MAFRADYCVLGNRREHVCKLGNGVTPPPAEFLIRAVIESLNGNTWPRQQPTVGPTWSERPVWTVSPLGCPETPSAASTASSTDTSAVSLTSGNQPDRPVSEFL